MTDPTPTPEETPKPETTPKPTPETSAITPEVQKLIDAAAAAARKDGEKSGRVAAESAIAEAKRIADEETARQKQIAAGEFETVKTGYETTVGELKQRATAAEEAVKKYEETLVPIITERLSALPAEASEDFPKDASAVERLDWLEKRTALLEKLAPTATQLGSRVPSTPRARTLTDAQRADAEKQALQRSGKYTPF